MFNATNLTAAEVAQNVIQILRNHREALEACHDIYRWSSALTSADLTAIGFSTADAGTILAAISDANAEYVTYNTGLPPSTYPQPSTAYIYSTTQAQVMGPQ